VASTRTAGSWQRWLWPLAVANLVVNIGIVVTGGAVRLTGSGLGCPTWPRCTDESYVAHGELGLHGAIEFGNRLLTWVLVAVALAFLLVVWQSGRRRLRRLGLIVALGIPAQALLGGVTVLTDLNPWVVGLHFMVSMSIIAICVLALEELRGPARPDAGRTVHRLVWAAFAALWVVLYLGTVVTGSGPHSGDLDSRRTGLDPEATSRVHALAVYVLAALTVATVWLARRGGLAVLLRASALFLVLELSQGVIGYVQYFLDLPEVLVALHMLGAALLSATGTWVLLAASPRGADRAQRVSSGSSATATKSSDR
jgi:heme a synthase